MHDTKNILLAFTLKQLYKGLNNQLPIPIMKSIAAYRKRQLCNSKLRFLTVAGSNQICNIKSRVFMLNTRPTGSPVGLQEGRLLLSDNNNFKMKLISYSFNYSGSNYLTTARSRVLLRSHQSLSYSRISQRFVKPESLLPFSQDFSFDPCLKSHQSSPQPLSCLSKILFNLVLLSLSTSSYLSLFFRNSLMYSSAPYAYSMTCQSQLPIHSKPP